MSEKKSQKRKEMTAGRAFVGFFVPIMVLIVLIAMGAEVTIGALAALFVMIGFCFYMGYDWSYIDKAMSEGVRQIATAAMIMLLVGCMVAVWMSSGTIPTLLYYGMKIITPNLFLPICFMCRYQLGCHQYHRRGSLRHGRGAWNSGCHGSWSRDFRSFLWR